MRFKIEFSPNKEMVPYDYQSKLNGYLHKILGKNNKFHDSISLYSTSSLHGSKSNKEETYINFKNGAIWFVSSVDGDFINTFLNNIHKDENSKFSYGMELDTITIISNNITPNRNGKYRFFTKSPVFLKDKYKNHYTYNDSVEMTSEMMKYTILNKAKKFGLEINSNDFEIYFDMSYNKKKVRSVKIKGINNKASACPIILETSNNDIAKFIYDVGIGHSTGSGFGFVL